MDLDHATCHRIISARDARYDGKFFTCVKTTGIYCRPICPARTPAEENCEFAPSAAAAEEAGYRACLRCRPESSPDLGAWRGTSSTVSRGLRLIEDGALDQGSVTDLADRLGVGERHLRRLFRQHLGATPIAVAQTRRVLLAKQLIHQTSLPMTEIAMASGFGSLRRFNETFTALYGKPPGSLRRGSGESENGLVLTLTYQPPYDWEQILAFLSLRAMTGVEAVENGVYKRILRLGEQTGIINVSHAPEVSAIRIEASLPDTAALPGVIAKVRRVFDLGADPAAIAEVLSADPVLAPMVEKRPGLRLPGAWDGLEIGVRAILGQQVTVKAATTIASRLVAKYGTRVETGNGLTHAFPNAQTLAGADIVGLGMPQKRADAISALARLAVEHPHLFEGGADPDELYAALTALPGIGPWTANYMAMRAARATDAFIEGDLIVRKNFSRGGEMISPKALAEHSAKWRPWRAYAVMHLWASSGDETEGENS
ncbi:AlkA N-terminal domain-containing protein [Parvularcula marina]|uniref:DNA-3-methyladenine glycosylase II n=1 Tax=Parvularcula marina TaxID=2292771 RepID=A0A371REQ4_9PROT|nr:AlkA N-terminal domain-containing protein [Parvularcula marina]RFB03924.1 DNA-3-methyladenine glycosylase 2 family protein [Parvularcula marina]